MSTQYDLYLQQHRSNVHKGFEWIRDNLPELLVDNVEWQTEFAHDASKNEPDEYAAYDAYFYGGNRSYKVVQDFNRAWLLHLHRNPHHWQYWVLINDEPDKGEVLLEMPYNYIIEMICDWWSFSWQKGDLSEIFNWYDKHSAYIKLAPKTRETVEDILWAIRGRLGYNVLAHHGVKGQKWGVQNGPPYPLISGDDIASKIYEIAKEKEKVITKDVIESSDIANCKLYGLENRLKTVESIRRKINKKQAESGQSEKEIANDIHDSVRYTTISDSNTFVHNYETFKKTMQKQGYTEVECKNYYPLFEQGIVKHKAVQSKFSTKDGFIFEVQFHTPESQDAKIKKIPLYEERRQVDIDPNRAKKLELEMEKLALDVPNPPGIESIKSYKKDSQNK